MLHKSFEIIETKADGDSGEFTALVSTFGNVDKVGDRVLPGAYAKTLTAWRKSGDPLPIILAHQWADVMAHVGYADAHNVKETSRGLLVKGKLDVEDNPVARQVYKLMKRRTLKEFSIGYSVPPGGERRAKDGANELIEIDLVECGPCLKGIDPRTELHAVKSALGVEEPPKDPEELRRDSTRIERELNDATLPEVAAVTEPDPEPEPEPVEPEPKAIDPAEQRKASERIEREIAEAKIPDDIQVPPAAPTKTDLEERLEKELQEVKDRLAATEALVEDLMTKKADATDKEPPRVRSVDPLRKRGEELALEVASADLPAAKPPTKATEPAPEGPSLEELKERSRDLMFEVLSY